PAKVWRERVFWMWLAIFLSGTVGRLAGSLAFAVMPGNLQTDSFVKARTIVVITMSIVSILIPLVIGISLARGRLVSQVSKLMALLENRRRLAWTALG